MEREPRKEDVVRDVVNFLARRAAEMQSRIPKTAKELRKEFGEDIKINIGNYASDLNLPESLDIPLPSSKDNLSETQSIRYVPESEGLFLIKAELGEDVPPTIIELDDEDWVDHGLTVLKVLMDIKHSQNPPPIPQKQ